jgi:hypothetical protein
MSFPKFLLILYYYGVGYKTKRNIMNNYETLFVLKPTLTDEETTANITKIKKIIVKEGAGYEPPLLQEYF